MKIWYTWLLAATLTIGTAVQTFAAVAPELTIGWLTGNDDLTYRDSGKGIIGDFTNEIDEIRELSGMLLAVKYPFGHWDCNLEYGWGKNKDYAGTKRDFELLSLTIDYRWLEWGCFYFRPYLGWLDLDLGSVAYSGVSLGVRAHYDLTARIGLDAACGYIVNPDLTYADQAYDDSSLWDYRLQLTYQLNDRFSLGLSYRAYQYDGRFSEYIDSYNYINGDLDSCTDFLTLAVTYRFALGEVNTKLTQKVDETKPRMEMGIRK